VTSLGSTGHRSIPRLARHVNWPLSGKEMGSLAIIHRTVRCAPDYAVSQATNGSHLCQRSVRNQQLPRVNRHHRIVWCGIVLSAVPWGQRLTMADFARKGREFQRLTMHRRHKATRAFQMKIKQLIGPLGV
jgi:hypothetical protein